MPSLFVNMAESLKLQNNFFAVIQMTMKYSFKSGQGITIQSAVYLDGDRMLIGEFFTDVDHKIALPSHYLRKSHAISSAMI